MDWTAWGALGELLGALAVVITLVYLAKQVRYSNVIARAEAYRDTRGRIAQMLDQWSNDRDWADLFIQIRFRGLRRHELSREQRAQAGLRFQVLVNQYAGIFHDVELGILPSSAYDLVGKVTFSTPYMKDVWPLLRDEHSSSFVEFFERQFDLEETSESVSELPAGVDSEQG